LSELLRRVDKHSYQERCYSGGEANLDEYIFLTPLSKEPVEIQRTVVAFLTILKGAIAESLLRKGDGS